MSSNKLINNFISHTKSIRFRLTLTYSVIVFSFVGIILLGLNVYVHQTLRREPPEILQHIYVVKRGMGRVPVMTEDDKERLREIREDDLERIEEITLLSLIPIGLFSFLIGYQVSGMFLSPIDQLRVRIDEIKASHLGEKIPVGIDDEIGRLISSFNDMSLRLQKSFSQQTQFVEDASHELRTPLTVIQTNLESALDDPQASLDDLKESIQTSLTAISQLAKLSEELLELTSTQNHTLDKVDLVELIRKEVDTISALNQSQATKIKFEHTQPTIIHSINIMQFTRAIRNLIENAVKYSKSANKPQVKVAINQSQEHIIITVSDNGPGIAKEYQKKIFKRFYRIDKSRNKASGGFGLGLAITKKIVEEHGGKISVKSEVGDTEFRIVLTTLD